jgi:predicted HTH transcriptional regulator
MTNRPFLVPASQKTTETLPVAESSPELLDMERVREHIARAVSRGRYTGPTDPMEYLLQKECVIEIGTERYATLAGLLCFGQDPQRLFPLAVVDIGHYAGTTPISYEVIHLEKHIGGTIFNQLERVETYLWLNTHHGATISDSSMQRVDVHEYPRIIIRELIVNMLAHRDYAIYGSAARVQLFKDRIEWISPGGLPPDITVETLLQEQRARNPVILSILFEAGYVEAFGQGLDTVVKVLADEGMQPPRFEDIRSSFIVSVYGKKLDRVSSDLVTGPLTEIQQKLLDFIRRQGEVAPSEIYERFESDDRSRRALQRDLRRLIEAQLIMSVGSSHTQRYLPIEPDR